MNRHEAILRSIETVTAQMYVQSVRLKPDTGIIENLKSSLNTLVGSLTKTESLYSIPCAIFDGDCCGILYADNDGSINCNECGREFEVKTKG